MKEKKNERLTVRPTGATKKALAKVEIQRALAALSMAETALQRALHNLIRHDCPPATLDSAAKEFKRAVKTLAFPVNTLAVARAVEKLKIKDLPQVPASAQSMSGMSRSEAIAFMDKMKGQIAEMVDQAEFTIEISAKQKGT